MIQKIPLFIGIGLIFASLITLIVMMSFDLKNKKDIPYWRQIVTLIAKAVLIIGVLFFGYSLVGAYIF